MAKQLYLNVLWHMHQPYYKNDMTGRFEMPWVFLHAIKDYYDLPWYLSRFPALKATFNLVPSLLVQLQEYEKADVNDRLLSLLRKEVSTLSSDERLYLLEILFFAQKETMVEPIARYAELYRKMDRGGMEGNRLQVLNESELLDLQVCFLLAWCGVYLRTHSKLVAELLIQKGFSQAQKVALLDELTDFVKGIIPFYKRLEEMGQIEISATPFYHPIMPLLMDSENGRKAKADALMPATRFAFPDDAAIHLKKALDFHTELFTHPPKGFWPSEGSVDESSAALYVSQGVQWICTDEEILYKSLGSWSKEDIYKRHSYETNSGAIAIMFRDRSLSDAIGFDYSRMDSKEAAKNLVGRLRSIYDKSSFSPSVNVILDGENAWEFYRNNGYDFFEALYSSFETTDWISTQRLSEAIENPEVPAAKMERLEPGSWINGNFAIWIGQDEKNRAWELLAKTKKDLAEKSGQLSDIVAQKILNEVMIAEGSDWFWWFGDTHFTAQKAEFDLLFRTHLMNAYRLAEIDVPPILTRPIIRLGDQGIHIPPKNPLSVSIDGKKSSFFEWMGAGEFDLEKMGGAMDSSTPYAKKVLYGSDDTFFSFSLIGSFEGLIDSSTLEITINGTIYGTVPFRTSSTKELIIGCGREFVEVSIPRKKIEEENIELSIKIIRQKDILQTIPFHGSLGIEIRNRYPDHWFI